MLTMHNSNTKYKKAKENEILIKILIILAENYIIEIENTSNERQIYYNVRATIKFIRKNYNNKLSLD